MSQVICFQNEQFEQELLMTFITHNAHLGQQGVERGNLSFRVSIEAYHYPLVIKEIIRVILKKIFFLESTIQVSHVTNDLEICIYMELSSWTNQSPECFDN